MQQCGFAATARAVGKDDYPVWWAGRLVCNAGDLIKVHDSRNSGETGPWPRPSG
ncbi:hypothetical protein BN9982_870016 [Mycobacterium tuberculosis]|nr:hypothetical protein BN9982_870016 [Mycobacterium tuberculosis]